MTRKYWISAAGRPGDRSDHFGAVCPSCTGSRGPPPATSRPAARENSVGYAKETPDRDLAG